MTKNLTYTDVGAFLAAIGTLIFQRNICAEEVLAGDRNEEIIKLITFHGIPEERAMELLAVLNLEDAIAFEIRKPPRYFSEIIADLDAMVWNNGRSEKVIHAEKLLRHLRLTAPNVESEVEAIKTIIAWLNLETPRPYKLCAIIKELSRVSFLPYTPESPYWAEQPK